MKIGHIGILVCVVGVILTAADGNYVATAWAVTAMFWAFAANV